MQIDPTSAKTASNLAVMLHVNLDDRPNAEHWYRVACELAPLDCEYAENLRNFVREGEEEKERLLELYGSRGRPVGQLHRGDSEDCCSLVLHPTHSDSDWLDDDVKRSKARMHSHMPARPPTHPPARLHEHTCTHTCARAHTHVRVHAKHRHEHAHTCACMHAHTHGRARTRMYARAQRCTHTRCACTCVGLDAHEVVPARMPMRACAHRSSWPICGWSIAKRRWSQSRRVPRSSCSATTMRR